MYFQLEVDYYSNKANKNKYKSFQLIVSTKKPLKVATDCTGHCICNDNLLLWVCVCVCVCVRARAYLFPP